MLHSAVNRLNVRLYTAADTERPRMSEYEAMLIDNNDNEVLEFFCRSNDEEQPGLSHDMAASCSQQGDSNPFSSGIIQH